MATSPLPITAEQRLILRTLVEAARTLPERENLFLRPGIQVKHSAITSECLLYDGDFIEMRDAGAIHALPSTFDQPLRFTVTSAGFADIDAVLSEEGRPVVRTYLTVPLEEARAEIRRQISRAKELIAAPASEKVLITRGVEEWTEGSQNLIANLDENRGRWYRYVVTMLGSYFPDQSQVTDFQRAAVGTVHESEHSDIAHWVGGIYLQLRNGVEFLESLDERLHFYVPPATVATANVTPTLPPSRKVFVVHGHDTDALRRMELFLHQLDLEPIVIMYRAGGGRTIVEQIEHHANVPFALVILTPDDVGYRAGHADEAKGRARQNVILELGYFMGRIGRGNVCALVKGEVDRPSDIDGVLYVPMDDAGTWRFKVAQNMNEVGIAVETGKIAV